MPRLLQRSANEVPSGGPRSPRIQLGADSSNPCKPPQSRGPLLAPIDALGCLAPSHIRDTRCEKENALSGWFPSQPSLAPQVHELFGPVGPPPKGTLLKSFKAHSSSTESGWLSALPSGARTSSGDEATCSPSSACKSCRRWNGLTMSVFGNCSHCLWAVSPLDGCQCGSPMKRSWRFLLTELPHAKNAGSSSSLEVGNFV